MSKPTPKNAINDIEGKDGVDFINVYSKGETEIGRRASHFAYSEFVHPTYGAFKSMEAFWIWIKLKNPEDPAVQCLRDMVGYQAKAFGRTVETVRVENFHEIIIAGNWHKFNQNPVLKQLMVESTLPFKHYYLSGNGQVTIRPLGYDWLMEGLEKIRKHLKLQVASNP
jgi:predicted NAD-dependent protein-ADP-ribosyltransferase YbiA (DUF1768 family)